jgi:hypothetical protein
MNSKLEQKIPVFIALSVLSFLWIFQLLWMMQILTTFDSFAAWVQYGTVSSGVSLYEYLEWAVLVGGATGLVYLTSFRALKWWELFIPSFFLQFLWLFNFITYTNNIGQNWLEQVWINSPLLYLAAVIYAGLVSLAIVVLKKLIEAKKWKSWEMMVLFLPVLLLFIGPLNPPLVIFTDWIKYATNWKLNMWFLGAGWDSFMYYFNLIVVFYIFGRGLSLLKRS